MTAEGVRRWNSGGRQSGGTKSSAGEGGGSDGAEGDSGSNIIHAFRGKEPCLDLAHTFFGRPWRPLAVCGSTGFSVRGQTDESGKNGAVGVLQAQYSVELSRHCARNSTGTFVLVQYLGTPDVFAVRLGELAGICGIAIGDTGNCAGGLCLG